MLQVKVEEQDYSVPYRDGIYQTGPATTTVKGNVITVAKPGEEVQDYEVFTEEDYEEDLTLYRVNF